MEYYKVLHWQSSRQWKLNWGYSARLSKRTAPLHHLHLRSGLYRRACACAWCLFHVLAFDSCWIYIKPTSKRGDSPFIGAVVLLFKYKLPKKFILKQNADRLRSTIKVSLNPFCRTFLNFAKSCIVSCLSEFNITKWGPPSSFLSYKVKSAYEPNWPIRPELIPVSVVF